MLDEENSPEDTSTELSATQAQPTVFTLENQLCRVSASAQVCTFLRRFLVYETTKWNRDFKTKQVEFGGKERNYLFDIGDNTFLSGFLPLVLKKLRDRGVAYEVVDLREDPGGFDSNADLRWISQPPREYQLEAVMRGIERKRGIIAHPTGSGKGDVSVGFFRALPELEWLFLSYNKQLVINVAERFRERNKEHGLPEPDIGMIGDGEMDLNNQYTFAVFKSLSENLRTPKVQALLKRKQAIIIDEAHSLPAQSNMKVVSACTNAYYRMGLTATPLGRSDQKSMYTIGLLGPIIHKMKNTELIEKGVVSQGTVNFNRYPAEELAVSGWTKVEQRGLIHHEARNRAVVKAALRHERPLVFITKQKHGQILTKMLRAEGKNVAFIYGAKNVGEREAAGKKLMRGELDVIVCSKVFTAGIDLPSVDAVVMACGGKSEIDTLQRRGRGSRVTAEKDEFVVEDFEDRHHPILERHMLARRRAYRTQGDNITYTDVDVGSTEPLWGTL